MTTKTQHAGAGWLENQLKLENRTLSPLGREVADILGYVYQGLYHIAGIEKREWENNRHIQIPVHDHLSTYDYSLLTTLVLLAHRRSIRIEIRPCNFNHIYLFFSRRDRSNHPIEGHPTIQQAIARFEETCYLPEATSQE